MAEHHTQAEGGDVCVRHVLCDVVDVEQIREQRCHRALHSGMERLWLI
jgi:hypothetical protein